MTMRSDSRYRVQESAATAEATHRIHEAAAPAGVVQRGGSPFNADGTVNVHIIRPCHGRGRGSHIYEAAMLEREAPKFAGWPMFIDHESPEAQRKAGGLPPSITRIGGEVLESWWDGSVPAEGRFGQGAVMGKVMPSPWMRDVIEAFPRLVQTSVNTFATDVKPRRTPQGTGYVVEGFADDGSVDWVTKAGAGGKIVQIMEAYFEEEDADATARMTDWLRDHRPAVVESLTNGAPTNHGEEDDDVKPEELRKAIGELPDEDRAGIIESLLDTDEGRQVVESVVDDRLRDVLPTSLEAAGEAIEKRALEAVDSRLTSGSLAEKAKRKLAEAAAEKGWPDAFIEDAQGRLADREFKPVEADGDTPAKSAEDVMEAAVTAEVERVGKLMEAANVQPRGRRVTTVTGAGNGGEDEQVAESDDTSPEDWRMALQEAGIAEPTEAYGIKKPEGGE